MNMKRKPDFNQLLKVMRREIPDRDVLYDTSQRILRRQEFLRLRISFEVNK